MTRSIDAANDKYLDALREINSRLQRAQREVSTGKRVATPSDDPDSVSALLQVRADAARIEQLQKNMVRTRAEVDAAEGVLQGAVKLFDRVRTLGMTAASGIHTATTRQGIADELRSIIDRFVGMANSEVDGRYLFSGDSDQAHAFRLDYATQTPPWGLYLGTASTRMAEHPTGVTFPVAMTAEDIFNNADPARNVLQSAENLRLALEANDEAAIQAAIAPLAGVSTHLNSALTFYGNAQSTVREAYDTGETIRLRLHSSVAELQDADITMSILELQQARFQQEAALQVRASSPKQSLFDYLR